MEPFVPIGAEGTLRGQHAICVGFVIRGCTVEGERYHWREYLLFGGPSAGYVWLMEEDGAWKFVTPLAAGDVHGEGSTVSYEGSPYGFKQQVDASVEYVVGEFYWRVEVGETVTATDYEGPLGTVSVERAPTEVTHSFCAPIDAREVGAAFGIALPVAPTFHFSGAPRRSAAGWMVLFVIIALIVILIVLADTCGGSSSGGPSFGNGNSTHYVGPSFGGK